MRKEHEQGQIFTSSASGENQLMVRGHVDFDILVDAISKMGLSEEKATEIKNIITMAGFHIWGLLQEGGAITLQGQIIPLGENKQRFLEPYFKYIPKKVTTTATGAVVEAKARLNNIGDLHLGHTEKVIILRQNAVKELGYDVFKSGACGLKFADTTDDRQRFEGSFDADKLAQAVTNHFTKLYYQNGIPIKGIVSPDTISHQLLLTIVDKSGRSNLKK